MGLGPLREGSQAGQVCELYLLAVLSTQEVIVAKEQVYACIEVLGSRRGPTKQEILDLEPLLRGIASLNAISPTVLKRSPVKLALLPAPLL
jgi:hypothetical protein